MLEVNIWQTIAMKLMCGDAHFQLIALVGGTGGTIWSESYIDKIALTCFDRLRWRYPWHSNGCYYRHTPEWYFPYQANNDHLMLNVYQIFATVMVHADLQMTKILSKLAHSWFR